MSGPENVTAPGVDGASGQSWWGDRLLAGGGFVLDVATGIEMLWGRDDQVLWADGEGLVIAGTQGVGKTTLAQQLVLTLIGVLANPVLGLPVPAPAQKVLYLAMDRPHQIRRAFRRQCRTEHQDLMDKSLVVWAGPPPADLAKNPELLRELAEHSHADVVVVDSLKDAALGLAEDEVGSGWNRAAQGLLAAGPNLIVLHHLKKQVTRGKTGLDDVYGSTWLTSGMGSVILLDGNPGDPIVEFRHLKSPAAEVSPMKVIVDHASGLMTVQERVDLVTVARVEHGITAKQAAQLVHGSTSARDVERARRQLDKLVTAMKLVKTSENGSIIYRSPFGSFSGREHGA